MRLLLAGVRHIHVADAAAVLGHRVDVAIAGVLDPSPAHGRRWADELSVPWWPGWREATLDGVDACAVYSRTSDHLGHVRQARHAGLAVFVEKPLAVGVEAAREVAELLDARAQLGFFLRYVPAVRALAERIRSGELGRVQSVSVRFVHRGWLDGWFDGELGWLAQPDEGGGGFLDLAVHCVDLLEWLVGRIEQVGEVRPAASGHHGHARFRLAGGVAGEIEAGWEGAAPDITVRVAGSQHDAEVRGGRLLVDGRLAAAGTAPAAELALQVWLDRLVGRAAAALVDAHAGVRNAELLDELRTRAS